MKRLTSLILALILVLSMSVPAFAANGGSITITNATKNDTYTLYKIFDATYSSSSDAVAYSIDESNQFFDYMFGDDADGRAAALFDYNPATDNVTRKEQATNQDIIDYLRTMVQDKTKNWAPAKDPITATGETVIFDGLGYGYYLIDKGTDTAVTISSNKTNVNVIDKTQVPGGEFNKFVYDEDTKTWTKSASANIGDILNYKVEFIATNYDGEYPVKYYTVRDNKGSALWVEFNTIQVKVGDKVLKRGYYHGAQGTSNTGEWEYLGDWGDTQKHEDNAEWYLMHRGFDDFEIVIPWLTNHNFEGTQTDYELTFADGAKNVYSSPIKVEVSYDAAVEPNAGIGSSDNSNLKNSAKLSWNSNRTKGPDDPSETQTSVFALGLTKIDADTDKVLAGAVFELYSDEDCTKPVYVIPTGVKGIYIVDDLNTNVSGMHRDSARKMYAAYLDAYLNGAVQKNVVTSEVNGKLAVIGLEAGTYYLKETQAPAGYNKLQHPVEIAVGSTNNQFFVIADENGNVIDGETAGNGYHKVEYAATATIVENSTGILLPSTGGVGTMILLAFGALIAMAFAIFLITNKKMSVYED